MRLSAIVVSTALAVCLTSIESSAEDCGRDQFDNPIPCPEPDGDGVRYVYDASDRAIHEVGGIGDGSESEGSGGPVWLTRYVVRCAPNSVDDPQAALCIDAACEASNGNNGYLVQVFRRLVEADAWEPWPGREAECRAADIAESYPLEDIREEIIGELEEHFEEVARPEVTVAPARNAVVNIPVLASTVDVGDIGFEIDNPLPGVVTGSPSYRWAWSNGSGGAGPGQPYDGTNPVENEGHYPVRATYAASGTHSVGLTVTWEIGLTVPGIPVITDIDPLVFEAGAEFPVRSGRTVLVD